MDGPHSFARAHSAASAFLQHCMQDMLQRQHGRANPQGCISLGGAPDRSLRVKSAHLGLAPRPVACAGTPKRGRPLCQALGPRMLEEANFSRQSWRAQTRAPLLSASPFSSCRWCGRYRPPLGPHLPRNGAPLHHTLRVSWCLRRVEFMSAPQSLARSNL